MYLIQGLIFIPRNVAQFNHPSCDPITECLVPFQQAAENSNITTALLKMGETGNELGVPDMNKEQFNELCNLIDSLSKCLDEKQAAAQCTDHRIFEIISRMLPCQPPNRQGTVYFSQKRPFYCKIKHLLRTKTIHYYFHHSTKQNIN